METTARRPGIPDPIPGGSRVGGHIHQLLTLARALTTAAHTAAHTATGPGAAGTSEPGAVFKTTDTPSVGDSLPGNALPAGDALPVRDGLLGSPLGVELDSLTDGQAVEWAQSLEQLNHFLQALLVQVAGDLAHRVRAGRFNQTGAGTPAGLLVQSLLLGRAEANRRLRLAGCFMATPDPLTGTVTEPTQPVLGQAFFSGTLSAEQAMIASGHIGDAGSLCAAGRIPETQRLEVEQTLTGYAAQEAPDFLHRVGTRILNHLDPDGQQPTEGTLLAKQGLFFHQPRRGLIHFEGHLTLPQYETMMITIGWATNPKNHTTPDKTTNTTKTGSASGSGNTTTDAAENDTDAKTTDINGAGAEGSPANTSGDTPAQGNLFNDPTGLVGLTTLFTTANTTTGAGLGTGVTPPPARPTPPPTPPPSATVPPERHRDQPEPVPEPVPVPVDAVGPGSTVPSTDEDGREPGPSPWLHHATDPAGIGWQHTPDTATGDGEDLSWLWGEPPPITPIGWDPPPNPNTGSGDGEDLSWLWGEPPPITPIGWDPPPNPNTTTGDYADTRAENTANSTTTTTDVSGTGVPAENTANGTTLPGTTREGTTTGSGTRTCAGEGFARVVDGVRIPAPGSGAGLDGLDPIDPASTDPAVKDRRTHAQRLLDGLITCLTLAASTKKLPINGGLKTQLIITTTHHDLHQHRAGKPATAHTPHNGPVPLALFDQACCDAEITHHYLDTNHTTLDVGRTQRLFTPAQRKILIARDLGCTFPDCTAPAYWCEAHHITPWHDGGTTSINNATLLCSHHHHLIHRTDWTITIHHGTPHYTPPYTLDPTTTPRRNTYHHGLPKNP